MFKVLLDHFIKVIKKGFALEKSHYKHLFVQKKKKKAELPIAVRIWMS